MKTCLPALLLTAAALGLSARGGDPLGMSLLIYAGLLLLVALGVFLLPKKTETARVKRHASVHLGCFALLLLILVTDFPFRATFGLSESPLRDLAMKVKAGEKPSFPLKVGLFTIQKAGLKEDGSTYLWTDSTPGGPQGFVLGYTGSGYNLWSELKLSSGWHYICED